MAETNLSELVEYQNDHDVLIELRTEMRGLRADLKNMTDNLGKSVTDHETRLRIIEGQVAIVLATKAASDRLTRVGGSVLIFVVGIAQFILGHYWR